MRKSALDFIDRFGAEAHRLGRTAPELFGAHLEHGTLRLEQCGLLIVSGRKADSVAADHVSFDIQNGYPNKPEQMFGPPIWEFVARKR